MAHQVWQTDLIHQAETRLAKCVSLYVSLAIRQHDFISAGLLQMFNASDDDILRLFLLMKADICALP